MSNLKFKSSLVNSILRLTVSTRVKLLIQSLLMLLTLILLYRSAHFSMFSTIAVLLCQYLVSGGYRFAYVLYKTLWRDVISFIRFQRTQFFLYSQRLRNGSVPKIFQKVAARQPHKVMFYFGDEQWTFKQVDDFSNRVANYFISQGFKRGDEVALFMDNKPEYVAIWLGLAKAGITSALINTNQRLNTLVHSLSVVNCKAVIFGSELIPAINDIYATMNEKENKLQYFCYDTLDREDDYVYRNSETEQAYEYQNLNNLIRSMSTEPPQERIDATQMTDRLLYIYTSGTEGLPKAAIIKHSRFVYLGAGSHYILALRNDDILYTSLPLYHLAGGTVGVCQAVVFGNTVAIRNKFSASNFFKDCVKYKCTVAQYIGEICRYLLAQPESPYDKSHSLRIIFGNGLRPNIWREFVNRFNIGQIAELYGSTEGNVSMVNVDNTEGACGFISQIPIANFFYPATLIRVDEKTGEPIRDKHGICIKVKPGETGEFVGKIIQNDPSRAFDGYANKDATQKKIIRNVFSKGDAAFASGDLLTMDRFGYLFFKDRCGDTYRWKGENVSTMEVEANISNNLQLADSIVFGVEVPGCEGKAGMAAILDPDHTVNLDELLAKMRKCMPVFAIPVFIRLAKQFEMTATHKLPKVSLRKEGYNPSLTKDPLFMLDLKQSKYVPIDQQLYEDIQKGLVKF